MGLGIGVAALGAVGGKKNQKALNKLLANAPKYKINQEAFENQNIARSQAYGRDRGIQMQQQNLEQDAANATQDVKSITGSTNALLSAISAINSNKNQNIRGLAMDEANLMNQKRQQLYGVNQQMIDEQDKAWNYNENMPYQMKVAALRDRKKANDELTLKGIDSQAATDSATIGAVGNMFKFA